MFGFGSNFTNVNQTLQTTLQALLCHFLFATPI